ncbi:MAG: hypothetical protein IJC17_05650 [Clostridia bacterium]|nr:hypothetical protein [Clostridia bacterium]
MTKQFLRSSYNISIDRDDGPSAQGAQTLGAKEAVFVEGTTKKAVWLAVHEFVAADATVTVSVGEGMRAQYNARGAIYALTDEKGHVLISNDTDEQTATVCGKIYWTSCRFDEGEELTADLSVSVSRNGESVTAWALDSATPADLHKQGFTLIPANRADRVADLSDYIENNRLDAAAVGFADENGHIDNVVFRAAMMTAGAYGVRLVMPTDTYYITADEDSPYGLDLSFIRPNGLHLDGQGSTVWMTDNFKGGFSFIHCRNITVENLTLDYVHTPWAQGEVEWVDAETQTFRLALDDDYNIFDDPRFHETIGGHFGTVRNREEPKFLSADALYYFFLKAVNKLGARSYEVTLSEVTPMVGTEINVGDKLLINNRVGCNMSMFDIRRCSDVTLRHITIYTCACTGVVGSQMAGPITVDDFHMIYRPNSNHWITSTADGVHIQGGPGAVTLTNSSFVGLLDDGMNLYQWRSLVDEVLADDKIVLNTDGGAMPVVGDTMEFFDTVGQRLLGVSRVVDITDSTGEGPHQRATLTLETPIAGMVGKETDVPTQGYLQRHEFAGTVIRGNLFKNLRGRGLVLHTTDTIIEGNRFEDISNHGIHGWYGYQEGLRIRNMTICDNTFERIGYYKREAYQDATGVISIRLDNSAATVQSQQMTFHENIVVKNNTVKDFHGCAINLGNIKGATVVDNTVELDLDEVRYNGERGIKVTYCEGATITGNRLSNAAGDAWKPLEMHDVTGAIIKKNTYNGTDL